MTRRGEASFTRPYCAMTEAGVCPNDHCQNILVQVVSQAGEANPKPKPKPKPKP